MTLDKAIEILSEEVKHPYSAKKMSRPDAIKLGIEALERLRAYRKGNLYPISELLPGETKE